MELQVKNFLRVSTLFIFALVLTFAIIGYSFFFLSAKYANSVIMGVTVILLFILIISLLTTYLLVKTFKNRYIHPIFHELIKFFVAVTYPFLKTISKLAKTDREQLKSFFIEINNILVDSKKYKVNPNRVLILTPHCLQDAGCKVKITNNPENCKKCGKCCVNGLLDLSSKYGAKFFVASGGTFARKIIKDIKPKFIIAIACERDLLSGINDVKSIPVIGVVNERPEGPCFNTRVDIERVEKALLNIIT